MTKVLIMAGGSGERFWPLSTSKNPKQLLSLVSDDSMIRETVDRIISLVSTSDVFIATNQVQVEGIKRELPELPLDNIIIEPAFRDTAAAIAYGSTYISKYEENPTIIVLAADHLISNVDEFNTALQLAVEEAQQGSIVTLGIKPTRPETGYGYINVSSKRLGEVTKSKRFLEKPSYETALDYYEDGHYLWNSGMFVFQYNTIMSELEKFVPNHVSVISKMKSSIFAYSGIELANRNKELFQEFERISIDYAVMEKSDRIKCIPVDIGWNDVGGYNSLDGLFPKDSNDNTVKHAKYMHVDSRNNIIISEKKDRLITTIGVDNMIVVDSENGLLVCNRDDAQRIKELLKKL
jgi:mannose-1-phosphate guanylyltransferase